MDLGNPNPLDRPSSFAVARGPVWVSVQSWQPGLLDPEPYSAVIKVGPLDQPPVADTNDNIASASASARVTVVEDLWSRLDLTPGSYWLLTGGPAGDVRELTCPKRMPGQKA